MYLSILALPLLGAATAGLLGRKLGVTGAQLITSTCMCTSALLSIVAFYEVALCGSPVSIYLTSWIDSGMMSVDWAFMFDSLTVSMLLPVTVVSSMVHIYSMSYMAGDPHNQRFFSYLSMFTFFMLVLVAGDNYLILFVGWEGIGVSSYLLINFWFTRIQANKSAIKAMTVNRVGDTFLSIAFFGVFWAFGNLDYATVFSLSPYMNETVLTIIGLLFLFAAMGKSAQLGLHMWLPDAMEGHLVLASAFASLAEQGRGKAVEAARAVRNLNSLMFSVMAALIISGRCIIRVNPGQETARFVIQLTTRFAEPILDYLFSLFSSFCTNGWVTRTTKDNRNDYSSTRSVLTSLTYPCFFLLYQLFFPEGKRTLTLENVSHLDLLGVAVLIMVTGYRIIMMRHATQFRTMPGYVDGLVINLGSLYSKEERQLLFNHLQSLGLPVDWTYTLRRTSRRGKPEIVIPTDKLPQALALLEAHLLPHYHYLFDPNWSPKEDINTDQDFD